MAILERDRRRLGSTEAGQAPATVHPGAVYLREGESYVVDSLSLEDGVALVHAETPAIRHAGEITHITVTGSGERGQFDAVSLGLVPVSVTHRVIG